MEASRLALMAKGEVLQSTVDELRTTTTALDKAPFMIVIFDSAAPDMPVRYVNEAFQS
jgi:hypothetical protein